MWDWIGMGILAVGLIGVFVLMIVGLVVNTKYEKEQKAKQPNNPKRDYPEPEELHVHAKVVKMECATRYVGIKQPKLMKDFLVFFEDDEGKAIRLFVDEEYYLSMEVGQVGNLTLIDGELYSFVLDE